jgi:hypothetical protein
LSFVHKEYFQDVAGETTIQQAFTAPRTGIYRMPDTNEHGLVKEQFVEKGLPKVDD